MRQLFLIAVRNLLQHSRRTLLLGGAIAGVTALLVVLLGLLNGIRSTILESATTLMTGHVNVSGFYKVTAGQSAPVVTHYRALLDLIRREVPEVDFVTQRGRGWSKLVSETSSMQSGIGGIDIRNEPGFRRVVRVKEGSLDALAEPGTILIFEEQARRLGVRVGDQLTLSAYTLRGTSNTVDTRIVAIARNVGLLSSFNSFVPDATLRSLYALNDDSTGALLVYLKDPRQVPRVEARLRDALTAAGYQMMDKDPRAFWFKFEVVNRESWTGQKLDVTTWEDEISFIQWTITAITWLSWLLIGILLVIIAVGIMNTLWIAIRERTREIGTLRAIGMQRARVLAMFLVEAFTLSASAALLGSALGLVACLVLNAAHLQVPPAVQLFLMRDELHLAVRPGALLFSILLITGCTTTISLLPSFLAARLQPVTAMHQVG
ncbi:MAG TPA: FtsX-like permease family protein [Myxococcaceae bacterium]|nr:FtsX-like permease family protein [Myxococcaceae bacterium]